MKNLTLKLEVKEILLQLVNTIQALTSDEYTEEIYLLANKSIGEHTRHIIELFQQLHIGYESGIVNYDNRKRDVRLQENIDFAIDSIAEIVAGLNRINKNLQIYSVYNHPETLIETNYFRELLFNLEHCVHHQAMLKIGLISLNILDVNDDLGVAKSTLLHRSKS